MLSRVFKTQWKYPTKSDWTTTVQKDMVDLDIGLSLDEIKEKSEYRIKGLCSRLNIGTKDYALDCLMTIKERHSKKENLHYVELKLQNYLKDDRIYIKEAINLFIFWTKMAKLKKKIRIVT